jgi:putative aldouronate transport system substrate-binding protein
MLNGRPTRRHMLGLLGASSVGVVAACSAPAATTSAPTAAPAPPTSPPAPAPTVTVVAAPKPTTPASTGTAANTPAAAAASAPGGKVIVGGVQLPTYVPYAGAQPDSPGSPDGMIDAGYKAYPANRPKSVTTTPGDGSDINIMTYTTGAVPPAVDQNTGWQQVNKEVGANLKMNMTPFADYFGTKLQVTIAGGQLPDLFFIIADPGITLVPEFFNAACADLTPYLSGDAVKEYPNLAAIPTRSWKTTVYDTKIYGVPVPLRPYFWWYWVHQELLDQDGLKQPTSADDLKQQLVHFTQPNAGLWGQGVEAGPIYAYGLWMGLFTSIFGAPNNWAVDSASGKFTATFETDQYKAATAYVRDLYTAGIFHPDSSNYNTISARDAFQARKFVYRYDGLEMYGFRKPPVPLTPAPNIQLVKPFGATGGAGSYWYGRPNFGFVVMPKTLSQDRIKMLLRVLNYLAAPFGTAEDLLLRFGVKDSEWTDGPNGPQFTDKGMADFMPWRNIVAPAPVAYLPVSAPEFPTLLQDWERELAAVGIDDATVGLVSRTYAQKGATANRTLGDGFDDIVTGRRPMSDYDGLVKDWLDAVGTTAKSEYQQAYAAAQAKS